MGSKVCLEEKEDSLDSSHFPHTATLALAKKWLSWTGLQAAEQVMGSPPSITEGQGVSGPVAELQGNFNTGMFMDTQCGQMLVHGPHI